MRLASTTLAYNDESIIAGTLRCLEPFVERRIVLLSEKPYFGDGAPPDRTEEIASDLGADVVKGTWPLDHYQRNVGVALCPDVDWIITFDSDEMMTRDEMKRFIDFLSKAAMPAVAILPEIYWRTTDYRLRPKPAYTPILAVRPHVRFNYIRNIDSPYTLWEDGEMHHLSWCDPKDIYKKVMHYAHATDFDGHKWYEENYKTWKKGQMAKLPTGEYATVHNPLPDELQEHLSYGAHA